MKLKGIDYLIIAAICFGILIYHFIVNKEIITHPYMGFLIFVLFAVGGFCAGKGFALIKNKE